MSNTITVEFAQSPAVVDLLTGLTERVENGCLYYLGKLNGEGYPMLRVPGKWTYGVNVRRLVWTGEYEREIPQDFWIYSKCEDKRCVEPSHLFAFRKMCGRLIGRLREVGQLVVGIVDGVLCSIAKRIRKSMVNKAVHEFVEYHNSDPDPQPPGDPEEFVKMSCCAIDCKTEEPICERTEWVSREELAAVPEGMTPSLLCRRHAWQFHHHLGHMLCMRPIKIRIERSS